MERIPTALLLSYRAMYSVIRGAPSKEEDEISRDVLRTVRVDAGLFFDFSGKPKEELALTSHRVLNAIAKVDDMGYCQGENYVVDVMLKAGLPEQDTFCLFLYALRQRHLHGIYRKEVPVLTEYLERFEEHLRRCLPKLAAHFEAQNYSAPLYALEWITTLFGLAARPLVALAALDLFLSSARNPILRLCVSLLSVMEEKLLYLDQEGLLRKFRLIAVDVDEEEVVVHALSSGCSTEMEGEGEEGGVGAVGTPLSTEKEDNLVPFDPFPSRSLSMVPDLLLVLRANACVIDGVVDLYGKAGSDLLVGKVDLQDAILGVNRSQGWDKLRITWLQHAVVAGGGHECMCLANEMLRFAIVHGAHGKAIAFMLGLCGADVNGVDKHLLSPLHLAALHNRPDVTRLLLLCGGAMELSGGVTRAYGGRMLTPEALSREACAPEGLLAEAGVNVGSAALHVLRGVVCLQCNSKQPKPKKCRICMLTFCKSCMGINHFCRKSSTKLSILPSEVSESDHSADLKRKEEEQEIQSKGHGESHGEGLGEAIKGGWDNLLFWQDSKKKNPNPKESVSEDMSQHNLRRGRDPSPMKSRMFEQSLCVSNPRDRNLLLDHAAGFVTKTLPSQVCVFWSSKDGLVVYCSCVRASIF
ncbi:unnamed protein product [Choristocarpus tenellus]